MNCFTCAYSLHIVNGIRYHREHLKYFIYGNLVKLMLLSYCEKWHSRYWLGLFRLGCQSYVPFHFSAEIIKNYSVNFTYAASNSLIDVKRLKEMF